MPPLHIAMLGYGAVAGEHARMLLSTPGVNLAAVIGPRREKAERFAAAFGQPPVFDEFQIARNAVALDAVIIASPTDLHLAQAREAIDAGLHALVEFPLVAAPNQILPLFKAAARADRVLAVAHTSRFIWSFRRAKELIDAGTLGRCKSVSYLRLLHRPPGTGAGGTQRTWTDDVLIHHSAHAIDLCHYWFGHNVTLVGVVAPTGPTGRRTSGLLLRGPDHLPITAALTYDASHSALQITLTLENAVLQINGFAHLRVDFADETGDRPRDDDEAYHEAIARQDTAFLYAILAHVPFPVSPDESIHLAHALTQALSLAQGP